MLLRCAQVAPTGEQYLRMMYHRRNAQENFVYLLTEASINGHNHIRTYRRFYSLLEYLLNGIMIKSRGKTITTTRERCSLFDESFFVSIKKVYRKNQGSNDLSKLIKRIVSK